LEVRPLLTPAGWRRPRVGDDQQLADKHRSMAAIERSSNPDAIAGEGLRSRCAARRVRLPTSAARSRCGLSPSSPVAARRLPAF
jgi:hypothetical protein